nr:hypothetical protein [Tanacetum cinerariifolium]
MQTQTSNALHNAIMEAGSKDRPPMLAPRIDNDIYSTVDACPNACEMWKAIERLKQGESINVQDLETNLYWEFRKFTSRDGESLESYYSRSQQAATRNKGKAIVNSPLPIYDQEPTMVTEDDEMSKDKEIDKLMALIYLSFNKIYKPTNNNLQTSSNTSRANQDNSPRISRGTGYDNQRIVNVVGARETVEQADWRGDTDDEPDNQELEAHYMYMAQIQEVTPDAADNSGDNPIHRQLWVLIAQTCIPSLFKTHLLPIQFASWLKRHRPKHGHRRLSHLNFNTINLLSKNDILIGLPKLKFVKDHLCSSCELGKAKRKSFQTKTTLSSKRRLQLLHMDLCGSMRVESINGKKYVLVIVDDYSRYTWTHFLRSKDETPKVLIYFLRLVQRGLHAQVRIVRTDKGTEFLNKTLHAYFASKGIHHQTSVARTPEQNGVVERRNRTLVEAARTIQSTAKVPLFFWAEAIATACFIQNRSLVIPRHEKTPYHIINDRKPSVKFFHIFCSLCYIIREGENRDKMKEKGDACIFVGYSNQSRAYRVFNKRTRVAVETIHVNFDELPQMASDHVSSDPVPQSGTVPTLNELDLLFSSMFDELLNGSTQVVSKSFDVTTANAPIHCQQQHTTPLNTQTTPEPTCQDLTQALTVTSTKNINQAETITENAEVEDDEFINIFYHPLEQVIGNPSQSVRTRRQLESDGEKCMFALTVSRIEPKNIKEAIADSAWIESMQKNFISLID